MRVPREAISAIEEGNLEKVKEYLPSTVAANALKVLIRIALRFHEDSKKHIKVASYLLLVLGDSQESLSYYSEFALVTVHQYAYEERHGFPDPEFRIFMRACGVKHLSQVKSLSKSLSSLWFVRRSNWYAKLLEKLKDTDKTWCIVEIHDHMERHMKELGVSPLITVKDTEKSAQQLLLEEEKDQQQRTKKLQKRLQKKKEKAQKCSSSDDSMECPICIEDLGSAEEYITTLRCGHRFHTMCIIEWRCRCSACPYCRQV